MMNHTETRTEAAAGGVALAIASGAFFFDIIGVFGLRLAVIGLLTAVGVGLLVCYKRPPEDQAS